MEIDIIDEPAANLEEYARVPMTFEVRSILEVEVRDGGFGGFALSERVLDVPWVKNYDAFDGGPPTWARKFDLSNWRSFVARSGGRRIGCATVAFDTEGIYMLEGRKDLAVLWDIRVIPEMQGRGVGAALLRAAEAWAAAKGCRQMKIETQNINVPACRFYAHEGYALGSIRRFAYTELPDEAELIWYKTLRPA